MTQLRSQEKPPGGSKEGGRVFVCVGEKDWYLTSGGMCQRNSCQAQEEIRTGGHWGDTVDFTAN
jgi:hypothetical protein